MIQKIKDRVAARQKKLKILTAAITAFSPREQSYLHIDGRVREIEDELAWLATMEIDYD